MKRIFRTRSDKILFWTGFSLGFLSVLSQIYIRGGLENSGPISFIDLPMAGIFWGFIFWGTGRLVGLIRKKFFS
jgi:hypothetical protein